MSYVYSLNFLNCIEPIDYAVVNLADDTYFYI